MSKARNNENQKIESLEPMILMSASGADIQGTDGDDTLVAMNPYESVDGGDGNDVIAGVGGDNQLCGGDGDDLLYTTSGYNSVDGGAGEDTVQYLDGNRADYSVLDIGNGRLQISNGERIDIVQNVELFQFNDGTVSLANLIGSNNAPVVTTSDHILVPENQTAVTTVQATDADGDTLTYSIANASDGALFAIDPNTGALSFINAPDFENPLDENGDNVYDVIVKVSDGKTTTLKTIWVGVTDVNENGGGNGAPIFTNLPGDNLIEVPENTMPVIDADSSDPDGDSVTYSISGGVDASLFQIDASTGALKFINNPDFENPGDSDGDNDYQVTISVSDGTDTTSRDLTVRVTDVNENGGGNNSPFFTNVEEGEMVFVNENVTFVGDADGIDPDGDTVTFSISDGIGTPGSGNNEDAGLFNIDPNTGVLSFKVAPDFENPSDADGDNEYQVTLVISDGNGGAQERKVVVKVQDLNENGGGNRAPFFTNVEENEMVMVAENTTLVGDANGIDPDGDAVTYSIAGGPDGALFTVDPNTGVVSFINAPDFENPGDNDGNNVYQLALRISDGSLSQVRNVQVKVTDVGDENGGGNRAPFFTNVEEGEIVTVPENTTLVGDANAQDPDGDTLTYSISGGADASLFTVNAQTGVVSFINAPDFENPGDADGNNNYQITLRVSDGSLTQERNVTVRVTDLNDTGSGNQAPFFTNVEQGEVVTVPENTTLVGDANGVDPDGDAVTYSIVGGADAGLFTVNAQTGVVSFVNAPDFENPGDADGNNNYQITLRISDGSLSQDRDVTVRVTDVTDGGVGNRAPFFTNVEQGEVVTVPENTTLVGDANGVDPDGDAVTYSIVGGADAGLFTVNAQTGVVSFVNAPDFENPGDADGNNNYQITLRISDGSLSQDRDVTVRVTDVGDGGTGNRAPFFTNVEEGEIVTVPENTTSVGDANGVDPDGDAVTYSIVGGADAGLFTVNAQTGVVSFVNAPDFENPGDADGNNNYQITLRISDGSLSQDRNVTVRVTDVGDGGGNNQAPFFTNVSQNEIVNVLTGTTLVGDADAQDPNGDTLTYSISGGADAAFFTVDPQTGVVSFINAQDVNNPLDANGDHIYEVRLRVSDGSLFQDRDVQVCIVGPDPGTNRAPIFTNVENGEVVWFDEGNTFVGDANAIDLDGDTLTFSIVGGADGGLFQINAQTGQLFFLTAPDFENPGDANGNNLYELVIRVSDGQSFVDRTIGVNVEDVNEGGNTGGGNTGGGNTGGGVNQVNQINLTNIFKQLFQGAGGHPYTGGSLY